MIKTVFALIEQNTILRNQKLTELRKGGDLRKWRRVEKVARPS